MNELVKEFQSERLELFAARLNQQKDMRANVCAISDSNNLWIIDGKLTGTISFFYGPLLLLPELFPDDWGCRERTSVSKGCSLLLNTD
jgi:hypothetical protein